MAFPDGAGYGDPAERSLGLVKRDLARGYMSPQSAAKDYTRSAHDIAQGQEAVPEETRYDDESSKDRSPAKYVL